MSSLISIRKIVCPPQAQAAGFTRLAHFSDFRGTTNVDLANDLSDGKDWRLAFAWQNLSGVSSPDRDTWLTFTPQSSANISQAGSEITFSAGATGSLNNIASACYSASASAGYVGNVFGPGGYFEARYKHDHISTFGTGFYMFPIEFFTGTGVSCVEVDIEEGVNATTLQTDIIEWDFSTNPAGRTTHASTYTHDSSVYTRYGFLWKTKAQNSGTGTLDFYTDDVSSRTQITYTTGAFSVMDTHRYVVFFSSQFASSIDYFAYWSS